jgi:hypothetical protein
MLKHHAQEMQRPSGRSICTEFRIRSKTTSKLGLYNKTLAKSALVTKILNEKMKNKTCGYFMPYRPQHARKKHGKNLQNSRLDFYF